MGSADAQVRTDLALSCIWYVLSFRTLPDTKSSGNVHIHSQREPLARAAESVLTGAEAV